MNVFICKCACFLFLEENERRKEGRKKGGRGTRKDGWMDGWKEGEEIKNKKAKNHKCISNAAKISKVFL